MKRVWLLLIAGLALPPMAAAQNQTVPLDLARALLGGGLNPLGGSQWVEIVVGGPPRQWKIEPLSDLRLLGSAAWANSATVVYEVTGDLKQAEDAVLAQLETAGWKATPLLHRPYAESGFIPTREYGPGGERGALCRGDRALLTIPLDVPGGPRALNVIYMGATLGGMCKTETEMRQVRDPWANMPTPKLEPPVGARVRTGSRGGGMESQQLGAYATTTMTVEKLMEHYGEQMRALGWQPQPAAMQRGAAIQNWQLKHEGSDWLATLAITAASDQTRILQLNLVNLTMLAKREF